MKDLLSLFDWTSLSAEVFLSCLGAVFFKGLPAQVDFRSGPNNPKITICFRAFPLTLNDLAVIFAQSKKGPIFHLSKAAHPRSYMRGVLKLLDQADTYNHKLAMQIVVLQEVPNSLSGCCKKFSISPFD